jgi:hypothetical protein
MWPRVSCLSQVLYGCPYVITSAEMVGMWLMLIYQGTSGAYISMLYLATVGQFPDLFSPSPGF